MPAMNFYKRGDGHYDFYVANGDGSIQGTCYNNNAVLMCGDTRVEDRLVCYSYICKNPNDFIVQGPAEEERLRVDRSCHH